MTTVTFATPLVVHPKWECVDSGTFLMITEYPDELFVLTTGIGGARLTVLNGSAAGASWTYGNAENIPFTISRVLKNVHITEIN